MTNWKAIQREYETSKLTLAQLAEKHSIPLGTVKSQKSRDTKNGNPWMRGDKKDATKIKVATKKPKEVATVKDARPDVEKVVEAFAEKTETNAELSDVQRFFCLYFVKYLNATKAYQKAYETTYENADSNAYRLMGNEGIRAEIERLKKARAAGIMLNKNDVLQKYIDIAFADISDYVEYGTTKEIMVDEEGFPLIDPITKEERTYERSYVHFKNSAEVDNSVLSEVKLGKDGVSIKLNDKMKALDVLAKYTDLLDERTKTKMQIEKEIVQTALKAKELEQFDKDEQNKDFTINFVRKG